MPNLQPNNDSPVSRMLTALVDVWRTVWTSHWKLHIGNFTHWEPHTEDFLLCALGLLIDTGHCHTVDGVSSKSSNYHRTLHNDSHCNRPVLWRTTLVTICCTQWVHSGYTVGLQHTHRTNRKKWLSYPSQTYPSKPAEQFEYSDCSHCDHAWHAVNSMQWTAGAYPCGYSLNTHWIIVNTTHFHAAAHRASID